MPPKKKLGLTVEATPEAPLDQTRSIYGDNHAATENALLVAHAHHLGNAGVIDEHMVDEFTKPYSKFHVHSVQYTKEYLAAHPDYTGEDADTIPTLQTAIKRQRDEDEAENKILEDYRTGRIDVWGNPTEITIAGGDTVTMSRVQDGQRQDGRSKAYESQRPSPWGEENTCDTTEADDSLSGDSVARAPVEHWHRDSSLQKGSIEAVVPNISRTAADLPAKGSFPTAVPSSFKERLAQFQYNPDLLPSSITSTVTPQLNRPMHKDPSRSSYSRASGTTPKKPLTISSSPTQPSPRRSRQTRTVKPLEPSYGNSDYTELNYYKAAALCRKRGIPSGGNVQEIRNHLIRDDTALSNGSPRTMASTNYRRTYRTVAPDEDGVDR